LSCTTKAPHPSLALTEANELGHGVERPGGVHHVNVQEGDERHPEGALVDGREVKRAGSLLDRVEVDDLRGDGTSSSEKRGTSTGSSKQDGAKVFLLDSIKKESRSQQISQRQGDDSLSKNLADEEYKHAARFEESCARSFRYQDLGIEAR
jgi:hypothetical protein